MAMGIVDLVSSVTSWNEFDGKFYIENSEITITCLGDVVAASAMPFDFRPLDFPIPATCISANNISNNTNGTTDNCTEAQGQFRFENFTTTIGFVDPMDEHHKLVIPDVSGSIVSTGSLDMIDKVGLLISPIVGQASPESKTRVVFGEQWTYMNVTDERRQLAITRELHGFEYCATDSITCTLCTNPMRPCSQSTCKFPLGDSSWSCGGHAFASGKARVDAFVIRSGEDTDCRGGRFWFAVNSPLEDNHPPKGSYIQIEENGGVIFQVQEVYNVTREMCVQENIMAGGCVNNSLKINQGSKVYYSSVALKLCLVSDDTSPELSSSTLSGGRAVIQTIFGFNLSAAKVKSDT